MPNKTQLSFSEFPKQKGGSRIGAGRPPTAPKTKTIRVAETIAFDCKRIDDQFREGLYSHREECIIIATPVHAGTRPWLRKYAAENGVTENDAACDIIAIALAQHYSDELG